MTPSDYILTGLTSIRKNRLRSILTIIGVAVAIGALTSMMSLGIGLQENMNTAIKENKLITQILVTSDKKDTSKLHLNDSVIVLLQNLAGVENAFLENRIPVKVLLNKSDNNTIIKSIPFNYSKYFPEKLYVKGGFFPNDTQNTLILTDRLLKELIKNSDTTLKNNSQKVDSIMLQFPGKSLQISVITIDPHIMGNMLAAMSAFISKKLPFRDSVLTFTVCGIVKQKTMNDWETGGYITEAVSHKIPQMNFENIWDLLDKKNTESYKSVAVYTKGIRETGTVQKEIQKMGLNARSMLDNMQEMKRMFIIMDSILGAIGVMALFIATLGLVNTLIMSIYERTREIGILKSLGAKDTQVRKLFIIEAGTIGLIGALIGVPLGWAVTRIADLVLFSTMFKDVDEKIVLFSFPWYLIIGAIAFAIIFSILAGLYPAMHAAKVDPVKALRHE